jgi:hypothetical protein
MPVRIGDLILALELLGLGWVTGLSEERMLLDARFPTPPPPYLVATLSDAIALWTTSQLTQSLIPKVPPSILNGGDLHSTQSCFGSFILATAFHFLDTRIRHTSLFGFLCYGPAYFGVQHAYTVFNTFLYGPSHSHRRTFLHLTAATAAAAAAADLQNEPNGSRTRGVVFSLPPSFPQLVFVNGGARERVLVFVFVFV